MARLLINNIDPVKGDFTIKRTKDNNGNIINEGVLMTHEYLEEIISIESDRYVITGVDVKSEEFGSFDYLITYTFIADDLDIKGGKTNLPENIKNKIESEFHNKELFGEEVK